MNFTFTITVELERVSGKFASKDEVEEQIREAIENADPGSVEGVGSDGDTEYNVITWEVS